MNVDETSCGPLTLMYITNNVEVAEIAEENGVDRIMVDLETLGKEERQKNMNTVKSHHTLNDVASLAKVLTKSELLVRVNPWHDNSSCEIEAVISAGAKRIMLPMWKTEKEAGLFLETVNKRTKTTLLLETKEAIECLDAVLKNPLIDEIHIGLNDLHLSLGRNFMFELLADGTVEMLCKKIGEKGVKYGFGGIAKIGEGTLPAERIVMEHYRLGSTRVILSRSFCNADEIKDISAIRLVFEKNVKRLREYENMLLKKQIDEYEDNKKVVKYLVEDIAKRVQENR